ncbi:glycosyltransferase family 2 protein [Noviherbaspirillum galbum]|uniref:Glycosyltransferase family 2 protein n=1 Tax=Noviherbaspirillum galbum TaxID=2709383 RepID=A0A6B3SJ81_9BURK|nr:glycosyltransferase family 2 protein [Noviherbaspirillum galbum]NEX60914.1 glycosyltransferase family 2 protein [Noviherbaspirillum galbum]
MKLSVILITKNEASNIRACLESVGFANEWIIVDSGSTDGTAQIARDFGATVIETPDWPGFGPQKNRALDAATGDWVLSIDADERITEPLRDEILAAMRDGAHAAYALPRLSSFCGYFIHHSGWYPDHIVRLFRRGAARFSDSLVHESLRVTQGTTGRLASHMIHYSYLDDESVLHKLNHYSTLGAKQAFAAGKRGGLGKAVGHALSAFLRSYVFKRGFLDGRAGLMVAISAAESTYHKYLKLMLLSEQAAKGIPRR